MHKIIFLISTFLISTAAFAAEGVIYNLKGPVLINDKLASEGSPIHFGDTILTGDKAKITVKLDGSVYRVGSRSRLSLPEKSKNFTLHVFFGSILAVFKRDTPKTILTQTAVLGVRGTGVFINVDQDQTYLCTCYGDIDFADAKDTNNAAHIHAEYHNVVAFNHHTHTFSKQGMVGHTSSDLFDLESFANRTPPSSFHVEQRANNTVD